MLAQIHNASAPIKNDVLVTHSDFNAYGIAAISLVRGDGRRYAATHAPKLDGNLSSLRVCWLRMDSQRRMSAVDHDKQM